MDPLVEFYQLYEAELGSFGVDAMANPKEVPTHSKNQQAPTVGTPTDELAAADHPETISRNKIDAALKSGKTPVEAHQSAYGKVDTHSVTSKSNLAKTLGRIVDDSRKGSVAPEPDSSNEPSIYAQIVDYDNETGTNDKRLRTPIEQEEDEDNSEAVTEEIDIVEDYDYNEDVNYLLMYGKA